MLCSETLFCFEQRWLLCFQKNMVRLFNFINATILIFLTAVEVVNWTFKCNKSWTPKGYPWKTWYSQVWCFMLSEGLAALAKVHRNSCQKAKEGTQSTTSPMNITSRKPQACWKSSGSEPCAQISYRKGLFSIAVSNADMKANILKGYANISVILSLFESMNMPRWSTCEMRHAVVSLCLNEKERVCLVYKPDNPLPSKICWLSMNQTQFFLRHLDSCCEVLKYVCMVYELIECYTVC